MKTKTLSKLEIIEETVKYYSKNPLKRRGAKYSNNSQVGCVYRTVRGTKCAVGRCGNSKFNFRFEGNVFSYAQQCISNLDIHLFPRYRGHGLDFWNDIQDLHDVGDNWTDKNISEKGLKIVEFLKKKYA